MGCDNKKPPPSPKKIAPDSAAGPAAPPPAQPQQPWNPGAAPVIPVVPSPAFSPSAQPVIGRVDANAQAAGISQSSLGTSGTVRNAASVEPICVKYAEPYNPWPDVINQGGDELPPREKPRSFGQHSKKWCKKGKFKCHAGKNKSKSNNEGEAKTSASNTNGNISTTTNATTESTESTDAPKIIRTASPNADSRETKSSKLALQGGDYGDRSQEIEDLNRTINQLLQSRGNGNTLPFDPTFGTGAPGTGVYTYRPKSNSTDCIQWQVPYSNSVDSTIPAATTNYSPMVPNNNSIRVPGPVQ